MPDQSITGVSVAKESGGEPDACAHTITIAGKTYLTVDGLANEVRKTPRTVRRWVAIGIGPPRIKIGNTPLFDPEKIPSWLARFEHEPVRSGRRRQRIT
jgi:hypothetical protein